MIKIDGDYSDYRDDTDPNYPGGKAIDAPSEESFAGTPYLAKWMNDINGFRQALFILAFGSMNGVSNEPDNIANSDSLNALMKLLSVKQNKLNPGSSLGNPLIIADMNQFTEPFSVGIVTQATANKPSMLDWTQYIAWAYNVVTPIPGSSTMCTRQIVFAFSGDMQERRKYSSNNNWSAWEARRNGVLRYTGDNWSNFANAYSFAQPYDVLIWTGGDGNVAGTPLRKGGVYQVQGNLDLAEIGCIGEDVTKANARHLADPTLLNASDASSPQSGFYEVALSGGFGEVLGVDDWWHHIIHLRHTHDNGFNAQLAIPFGHHIVKFRGQQGPSWSPWLKFAFCESPAFTGSPTINGNPIAVAASTSDPNETDLPVGSYILANSLNLPADRNGQVVPQLSISGNSVGYTLDALGYTWALSGTWRSCGGVEISYPNNIIMCRRVA